MKATSLSGLPQKKLTTGHSKLERFGITPGRWLAMLSADDAAMRRLADAWPQSIAEGDPCFSVFSAVRVGEFLGLSGLKDGSVPKPQADGRIIYLPPCIQSLGALRGTKAPMNKNQDWYDKYPHAAQPGYWEVMLPIPDSNSKNQSQQDQVVPAGFQRTPVLVDALLLTVYKLATGDDLLDNDWVRCSEQASGGFRFDLSFSLGLLIVDSLWNDAYASDDVWASAARWISS